MKINEFFEKGYYINLDRRPDRDELFKNEMKKVGLENFVERVSAEDSINELDPMKKHYYCAASYHKIFKRAYEEKYEKIIIFEDDAAFYDDRDISSIDLISNAFDELEKFSDWEMIFLGGCPLYHMEIVSKSLAKVGWVLGTHAVGYKRSVIEKVVKEYVPFKDGTIDGWYSNSPSINKYLINPFAMYQRPVTSDLDAHGFIPNASNYIDCYDRVNKIIKYNEKD